MQLDRCPKCAAAVRKDADWCTLCYADLRPAPEPPPPPVRATAPSAVPAHSDHLDAPYERVLAAVYGGNSVPQLPFDTATEPESEPGKTPGWPCSSCGEMNSFDTANCGVCMSPFAAELRGATPTVDRKRMMTMAIGVAAIFLLLVAALTYVTTKRPPAGGDTTVTVGDVAPPDEQFDQAPVQQAPAQLPDQQVQPGQAVPGQAVPGQAVPGQAVPGQAVPGQAVPGQAVPGQAVPGQAVPGQAVPGQTAPQVVTQ